MRHIGDWVRIKSREWYDSNKNENGYVKINKHVGLFTPKKAELCGQVAIIIDKFDNYYWINLDNHKGIWVDEMFDNL